MTAGKYGKIFISYLRIGMSSIGAGASAVMIEEIVEKRGWLTFEEYSQAMSLTALVPGPFHVNLAIATGNLVGGPGGGLLAAISFILPGFLVAMLLALLVFQAGVYSWINMHPGVAMGILASIAGLLLSAAIKLGQRHVEHRADWVITIAGALMLLALKVSFAPVIAMCGLAYAAYRSAYDLH